MRILLLVLAAFCLPAAVLAQPAPEPAPVHVEITPVRGNVYDVSDGRTHTVLLTTSQGIVLVDPLSRPVGRALRARIDERFPGTPVRYVLLTHHHSDRAAGTGAFEQAQFIAHRDYEDALSRARRTGDAEYRFVRDVKDVFDRSRNVEIGGTSARIVHVRSAHAPDMAVVYFPDEKLLFAVAPPPVQAVPFSFASVRTRDVLGWLSDVEALDADTLLFDDGTSLGGAEFRQLKSYLRALETDVTAAYERGLSLSDILPSPLPASQTASPHYGDRVAQITAVFRARHLLRVDVSARGNGVYASRHAWALCDSTFEVCSSGGLVSGGSAALAVTVGRRLGAVVESSWQQQYWSARGRPGFAEETALRLSRFATLVRYGAPKPGRSTILPVAGLSWTSGDVRGLSQRTGVLVPAGGYREIAAADKRVGLVGGADVFRTTARGLSLTASFRFNRLLKETPAYWPASSDMQFGIGVSLPLVRRLTFR